MSANNFLLQRHHRIETVQKQRQAMSGKPDVSGERSTELALPPCCHAGPLKSFTMIKSGTLSLSGADKHLKSTARGETAGRASTSEAGDKCENPWSRPPP